MAHHLPYVTHRFVPYVRVTTRRNKPTIMTPSGYHKFVDSATLAPDDDDVCLFVSLLKSNKGGEW